MPRDLQNTKLFEYLRQRETEDGFFTGEILNPVQAIVNEVEPILNQVVRAFPEYTLHDPAHGIRVLENMGKIIPPKTLKQLNIIELSILIYAAYLHDIGMAASQNELLEWLESGEGKAFIVANEKWSNLLEQLKEKNNDTAQRRVEDMAFTDYLRERHVQRGAGFVRSHFDPDGRSSNRIEVREVNYADLVALVCQAHREDPMHLKGPMYRCDDLVRDFSVNLQYLSVILILADELDLDPERTPQVLLDFINPQDPTSATEWKKHRSIRGWQFTPKRIRFRARCSHPAIQRGLREWMEKIEPKRRDCITVVSDNRAEITAKYQLHLTEPIPVNTIEPELDTVTGQPKYIYTDFKFELNYEKIISLLMGRQLWGDPQIALRELLQNALDTCRHREALSKPHDVPYRPEIKFTQRIEPDGTCILACEDNGMGMNQDIIEHYFSCIGRSYYQSTEFRGQNLDFSPASQFGFGIMSCFMLADKITVGTCRLNDDLGTLSDPLLVELSRIGRYLVTKRGQRQKPGTQIALQVSAPIEHLSGYLATIAPHVEYDIQVLDRKVASIVTAQGYELHKESRRLETLSHFRRMLRCFDFDFSRSETEGLEGKLRLVFLEGRSIPLAWEIQRKQLWWIAENGTIRYGDPDGKSESSWDEPPHKWSQDGVQVAGPGPIGSKADASLPLPVPCDYDLDLRGNWRVSLDIARKNYLQDEELSHFKRRFCETAADCFRQILESENMFPTAECPATRAFVDELFRRSTPLLREELYKALDYWPDGLEHG